MATHFDLSQGFHQVTIKQKVGIKCQQGIHWCPDTCFLLVKIYLHAIGCSI